MELQTLPGLFISHGSPMLALDPEQVGPALHRLGINLPIPKAIIVMSAHWESKALEVSISTVLKRGMTSADFLKSYMKFAIVHQANQNLQKKS